MTTIPRRRARPQEPAADAAMLSIGALSRAAGIPMPTLRTWERRYGVPSPVRKPSGHRLYPATTVEQLRRVARLIERGHRAGDALAATPGEIEQLLALPAPEPGGRARLAAGTAPVLSGMLELLRTFEREPLLGALRSHWDRLGPLDFLENVAGRFMTEVGDGWRTGRLHVRHEHFAAACMAAFLRTVREPYDRAARGPRVVLTTLHGEQHHGGALMASVVLARRGYRLVEMGAGLPAPEIAQVASAPGIAAVALSVSACADPVHAAREIRTLRGAMPAGVALWLGGAGAPPAPAGVDGFADLVAFDAHLARH